ncbi:hypothetical protein MBLNU230_g2618t1 [Neophaeotheca triangularis]
MPWKVPPPPFASITERNGADSPLLRLAPKIRNRINSYIISNDWSIGDLKPLKIHAGLLGTTTDPRRRPIERKFPLLANRVPAQMLKFCRNVEFWLQTLQGDRSRRFNHYVIIDFFNRTVHDYTLERPQRIARGLDIGLQETIGAL